MATAEERREVFAEAALALADVIGEVEGATTAFDLQITDLGEVVLQDGELSKIAEVQRILFRLVGEEYVAILEEEQR